ncbi:hypothetical protein CWR43_27920 [Rhizobium sullae]|uniref:Uncharacterized protein n=1 Tax=Rhizobium sullae TaxID=50338 RepID=A0A2N0D2Y5_RHISU|nr:hypothetical protein [Rhizobium sullae]PKA40412.1 hypothetical protein CWR43_27920 [Rhizobium sullae]
MSAHTPTPWVIVVDEDSGEEEWRAADGYDIVLATDCDWTEADKSFAFRAVNAHDDLMTGLRTIANYLDKGLAVSASALVDELLAKHGGA